jgi:hypothetical protein
MEDGIEVVFNHLKPYKIKGESNNLNLEEKYIIDLEEESVAEAGITEVGGFDVDSNGNIFFWNIMSNDNFIFKFNGNGKYVGSFGRSGQGPIKVKWI